MPPPLPAVLRQKLTDFRRRLWSTKTMEASFAALFGLAASFLLVFTLDRFMETPGALRLGLLVAGLVGGVVFLPLALARWVGGHRSLMSVARRIAREDIHAGDRLLGVLELTEDAEEFRRSPELSLAAIRQGEETLADRDVSHTLPRSRHRVWGSAAAAALVVVVAGFAIVPDAAGNALARWFRPLANIERFTFTRLVPYEEQRVVARYEPFQVVLELDDTTRQSPDRATIRLAGGETIAAERGDRAFTFELPGLASETAAHIAVGDYRGEVSIEPVDRPEVSAVRAEIGLPSYLELPEPRVKDVRGGTVGVVAGASVSIAAEMTRELESAEWSAASTVVDGATVSTSSFEVTESTDSQLVWRDVHGLAGTVPFQLGLRARPDAKPTVVLVGLRQEMILLYDQVVPFSVQSNDDFGVRQVGLEWEGVGTPEADYDSAKGEKMLGLGEPGSTELELLATLHPKNLGIDPQRLRIRAFAIDALPGRERAYSAPVVVQVMTEDDHMIWLTRALGRWYDEAVEVRDEENSLLKTNEELFTLSNAELDTPKVRRKIQEQAAAERINGRRLSRLVGTGSKLLAEAVRNTQFNANTTADWADMMAALEDIASNRMPSVAELLTQAAEAEVANAQPSPQAGIDRDDQPSPPSNQVAKVELPNAPTVADVESSFNEPGKPKEGGGASKAPPANLTLATTTVEGGGAQNDDDPPPDDSGGDQPPSPTREELAAAIAEQRALMEEFQKVAGKIQEVLAELEGSTFVKRLKALSRAESGVADDLDTTLASGFGTDEVPKSSEYAIEKVGRIQEASGHRASLVRADMAAYIERLKGGGQDVAKFETVYSEMGDVGVAREMTAIDDLSEIGHAGEAIAGAENLADDLDRWAEILVGPG